MEKPCLVKKGAQRGESPPPQGENPARGLGGAGSPPIPHCFRGDPLSRFFLVPGGKFRGHDDFDHLHVFGVAQHLMLDPGAIRVQAILATARQNWLPSPASTIPYWRRTRCPIRYAFGFLRQACGRPCGYSARRSPSALRKRLLRGFQRAGRDTPPRPCPLRTPVARPGSLPTVPTNLAYTEIPLQNPLCKPLPGLDLIP